MSAALEGVRGACESGKTGYRRRSDAVRVLRQTQTRSTEAHHLYRAYLCPLCGDYHLTKRRRWA